MKKPKNPQKENLVGIDGRDLFQTPNYATELLVPFLDRFLTTFPLRKSHIWKCAAGEYKITKVLENHGFLVTSTDLRMSVPFNFLTDTSLLMDIDCIVTNPPFSLKRKFYLKCREYNKPFALLIPADYSGWIIDAIRFDGAEKIIPSRRIDFITPNYADSHAQFHSMWLTWGFGLGKSETFVELTTEMKKYI